MGIKITELDSVNVIKSSDELPLSQDNGNSSRTTFKVNTSQLANFININPNKRIDDLSALVSGTNTIDPSLLNKYLPLSGGTMTGFIDLSGNNLKRFSANIITVTDNTTLTDIHNGAIMMVNKPSSNNPDDRVLVQVPTNLLTGFNVLIIQTGGMQVKITKSDNSITLANPDNALSTRRQYAQINLCMLSPTLAWVTGDMV
jgi:hypothetical protein